MSLHSLFSIRRPVSWDSDYSERPEVQMNSGSIPDVYFLEKTASFQWTYISHPFFPKHTTTTRNISPTIVARSNHQDLSPYPLKHSILLGFEGVDLDLHFHQRNSISPSIPLSSCYSWVLRSPRRFAVIPVVLVAVETSWGAFNWVVECPPRPCDSCGFGSHGNLVRAYNWVVECASSL